MRRGIVGIAALVAIMAYCSTAQATTTLVYGFEGGADGFGPNGGGTYTQDTIGATEGTKSLKALIPAGASFVGGITGTLPPAIGDPPGVDFVLFDMTIVDPVPSGFADMGVTIFGCTQGAACGNPFQFADFESIAGKAAGTYLDRRIDLNNSLHAHPITFQTGLSFNQIFGPNPGAPNDIIPTHFQFYFNKTGGVDGVPVTVYIDNVRVGQIPEPATLSLLGMAAVGMGVFARRKR